VVDTKLKASWGDKVKEIAHRLVLDDFIELLNAVNGE